MAIQPTAAQSAYTNQALSVCGLQNTASVKQRIDLFSLSLSSSRYVRCRNLTTQVNATHRRVFPRCAYPLRPRRTGQEAQAFPQSADSSRASPLPRLATCSSNISPLLRNPSFAPSNRPSTPLRRDVRSVHSSNREPYPADKLLKFRS